MINKNLLFFSITFLAVLMSCTGPVTKKISESFVDQKGFNNLEVDTSYLFGVWTTHRDNVEPALIFEKDKVVVIKSTELPRPYLINKNELTIYFEEHKIQGTIQLLTKDTLRVAYKSLLTTQDYIKLKE